MSAPDVAREAREFARLDFEPWPEDQIIDMQKDFSEPAYNKMMGELGVWLRLSSCFLRSTKPELVELTRKFLESDDPKVGAEEFFKTMESIVDAAKYFKSLHTILDAAFARLSCAASVVTEEQ